MTARLSDEARRGAFAKAERLAAARAVAEKLTDDECQILYVEIETRLAQATGTHIVPMVIETQPAPVDAPIELPVTEVTETQSALADAPELSFMEAKRLAVAAFERDYLARLMARSGDSVTEAARLAQVDRTNFRRLLQRYGLRPRGAGMKKAEPTAKYTDQILVILDDNQRGLRTCEIAERTQQTLQSAFGILKLLERQGRVARHGERYNTLWTLQGCSPVPRVETIPAAAVNVLSRAPGPMDGRRLLDEIGASLLRSIGKRPSDAALRRGISRLIAGGTLAYHGANEHGPLYVLVAQERGAPAPNLN